MTPPLPEYFDAEQVGDKWHLTCKVCGRRWSLPLNNDHPGNLLKLLEHAMKHKRKGAAVLEVALVLPLFLLIFMGAIHFAKVLVVRHVVQNAVSQAARSIAVNDTCQQTPVEQAVSRQAAKDDAKARILAAGALVRVTPTVVFTDVPRDKATDTRVTVTIPCNQFSLWPTSLVYTETCMMRSESL